MTSSFLATSSLNSQPMVVTDTFEIRDVTVEPSMTSSQVLPVLPAILSAPEICRRLSPPPIPPWLYESPEKLHQMVSNCSSWKKYMDLCSGQLPPEYPRVLALRDRPEASGSQWVPSIIVLILGACIIFGTYLLYGRYKYKRTKFGLPPAEYHKCTRGCRSCQYGRHGNMMSSSSTVETQLSSVCASSPDDHPYNVTSILPPPQPVLYPSHHSAYTRPELRGWGSIYGIPDDQRSSVFDPDSIYERPRPLIVNRGDRGQGEILLSPIQLHDDGSMLPTGPLYVSGLSSSSDYYSSLSLPVEADTGGKIYTGIVHQGHDSKSNHDYEEFEGEDLSYVQIHQSPNSPVNARGNWVGTNASKKNKMKRVDSSSDSKSSVRNVMNRCRKAGATLLHGVVSNKTKSDRGTQGPTLKREHSGKSITSKLKNSFRKSKSFDQTVGANQANQLNYYTQPPSPTYPSENDARIMDRNNASPPVGRTPVIVTANREFSGPRSQTKLAQGRQAAIAKLRGLGDYVRSRGHSQSVSDKPRQYPANHEVRTSQSCSDLGYVNEAFDNVKETGPRTKQFSFRKFRKSSLMKRFRKHPSTSGTHERQGQS